MRIKTTQNVEVELDYLKSRLLFDNNAQVLRLAISYAMFKEVIEITKVAEDGFAIDLNIIFAEDYQMYEYLLTNTFEDSSFREIVCFLIDYGVQELIIDIRYAKNDVTIFLETILGESCI